MTERNDARGRRPGVWHAGAVLASLMAFASISTDFYLPAMPEMAEAMGTSHGAMEFTVTGYLVGLSLGQLVWGPVSDHLGRRGPIALGLIMFIVGSAGCGLSNSVGPIIMWRVVQAVGASASVVLSRAMVRDLFHGDRAAQVMSLLMAVMTVSPIIAPSVGALIAGVAGWRAIFGLLVLIGLAALGGLFTLPETLEDDNRSPSLRIGAAFRTYGMLMREPMVMGHALVVGTFYIGIFSYVAATPTAFIEHHGVSPTVYGLLFAVCSVGITAGSLLNSRLVTRIGRMRCLQLGTGITALAGTAMAAVAWTDFAGAPGLFVPLVVFMTCTGLIVPNALTGALEHTPRDAGSASALCGAIQYGGGILGSALVGIFADGTAWPLGWTLAVAGIGAFAGSIVLRAAERRETAWS